MKRSAMFTVCGACLLLTNCGEPVVPADSEIAAELRALRAVLVQQQKAGAGALPAPGPDASPDRAQIVTALEPLREVLDGLVQSQHDLQTRQVALTHELQRWSQLLVENTTAARHEEAQAMSVRLQQLEKTLQEQDTRHRQVESLMQGAIDRTADRLGNFLQRLEGMQPGPGVPPNPAGTPAGTPARSGGNNLPGAPAGGGGTTPPAAGGGQDQNATAGAVGRAPRPTLTFWWMLVAVLAASLGVVFFLRLLRSSNRSYAASSRQAGPNDPDSPREPEIDRGVQEIWAAAALLGEAVGRLRQTTAPTNADPSGAPATLDDGVDLSDVFVLDDELLKGAATRAEAAPEPSSTDGHGPTKPPLPTVVVCRLPGVDAGRAHAEVVRILAEDPRVLRLPEPVVTTTPTAVEVAFQVLPGLPASERSQIEQGLRDAVG